MLSGPVPRNLRSGLATPDRGGRHGPDLQWPAARATDLARADETTRITIIEAWSMPAALRSGGDRKLVWAAETTRGLPAIAAAQALVRLGSSNVALGTA